MDVASLACDGKQAKGSSYCIVKPTLSQTRDRFDIDIFPIGVFERFEIKRSLRCRSSGRGSRDPRSSGTSPSLIDALSVNVSYFEEPPGSDP